MPKAKKEAEAPAVEEVVSGLNQHNIVDASTNEILAFAQDVAGLEFDEGAGREYIIQEVFEALEWDAYNPSDDATHVRLTLNRTESEKQPYRGGWNGRGFSIVRGKPVTIPIEYYNTMLDAASRSYTLEKVEKTEDLREGSPASRRIPRGSLPIVIHSFMNKGKSLSQTIREAKGKVAAEKSETED